MYKVGKYVRVQSLEEAYDLRQKKGAAILGGGMWLRLGHRNIPLLIDLCGLNLNRISETGKEFSIGAMTSLREVEIHPRLKEHFSDVFHEALRHIVGVQFRNGATIGGSVYGRFGFSDVLTLLMAMDAQAEFFQEGRVPVESLAGRPMERDILTAVHIRKNTGPVFYASQRLSQTDIPLLNCAVAAGSFGVRAAVGARPFRAQCRQWDHIPSQVEVLDFAGSLHYGSDMRASAQYRRHLAEVFMERGVQMLRGKEER